MKKILFILTFIIFSFYITTFSINDFKENSLYYTDSDNNWKIDTFFVDFNKELTWSLNLSKIFLYSNSGWLSTSRLDSIAWNTIFSSYSLSWSTLVLNLIEQDNSIKNLIVDNTTSSHLRIKTNAWVWLKDLDWNEIKLLYTSSFLNYTNIFYKEILSENEDNSQNQNWNTEIKSWTLTETWNINSSSWSENLAEINSKHIFQNPTYLLNKDLESLEYICDNNEVDCKINFDLLLENSGSFIEIDEKKYACLWDFWLWNIAWEENKCNPLSITIPKGIFNINYKIYDKNNPLSFTWKTIKISNLEKITEDNNENTSESQTWSETENSSSWIENLDINVKNTFQNPTYFIQKEENLSEYNCDTSKTECKANFNLQIDNSWSLSDIDEKNYTCLWDFWLWNHLLDENNCNPWTITFPIWSYNINYKITLKNDNSKIYKKEFTLKNTWYKPIISTQTTYLLNVVSNYYIDIPNIEVQSWLDENNNCLKNDCKVNFIYETKDSRQACLWDFWDWKYKSWDEKKCNPPSVTFWTWSHKVLLKVYDEKNSFNYKTKEFFLKNEVKINENISNNSTKNLKAIISLQTKIDENKYLSGNILYCYSENCSLNFDGRDSENQENLKLNYFWDFWNWITLNSANPNSIKFESWEYKIILKITDEENNISTDELFVIVKPKNIENIERKSITKNQKKSLIISSVFPNPKWNDFLEYVELQNIIDEKISLNWCEIQNSTKKYKITDNIFLSKDEKIKFYNFETKLNLPNSKSFNLSLVCDSSKLDTFLWNNKIYENMIISKDFLDKNITKIENQKDEIVFYSWNEIIFKSKKIIPNPLKDISKLDISTEDKKQKIAEVINKSFSQKISKLKSWVKIYWNFIPNFKLLIELEQKSQDLSFNFISKTYAWNDLFELKTDINWNYEYFIKTPIIWNYEVKNYLKIDDKTSIQLQNNSEFDVDNDYLDYVNSSKKTLNSTKSITNFEANILLQTKKTKNNEIFKNKIICLSWACSINFESKEKNKELNYYWEFWNWVFSRKQNPWSIEFKPWKYTISLYVNNWTKELKDYFYVEVNKKTQKEKTTKNSILENKSLLNSQILPNKQDLEILKSDFKIKIIYTILLFLVFLVLSFLVLRKKELI